SVAPLLVVAGIFAGGGEGGLGAALIGGLVPAALALAGLIVLGRLALRPFFHFVAETRSPEFFMAACLLVGLYFVSVGAEINPALIVAKPGLILGLAAALIGLKGVILFGLARGFGLPWRVGAEMALLLGPGGEFGFVMIGAALAGGLVDRALSTTLVTAVAISMLAIAPLARLGALIDARPRPHADGPPEEAPPESEERRVVIVGYGRVGALIGDMLDMHKVPFVAVDSGARLAGKPVYYGDASRPDYLRRCGVETARAVVVTMDSPRANEVVVETTRR